MRCSLPIVTQDRVVEVMVDRVVERYVEVSVCALLQHVCIHPYLHMHMCTQRSADTCTDERAQYAVHMRLSSGLGQERCDGCRKKTMKNALRNMTRTAWRLHTDEYHLLTDLRRNCRCLWNAWCSVTSLWK